MKRKTDYKIGQLLELIDIDFNNWNLGANVKIINKDDNQYHVKNVATGEFVWVNENQIAPWS